MSRDVDAAVIAPMRRRFRPPREAEACTEEALGYYRRALERFPRPVLERAWQAAVERWEYPFWPDLKRILEAAEKLQPPRPEPPAQADWAEQAAAMAYAYAEKFMKTRKEAARAREGGYAAPLKRYVTEAAYVQAQLLLGRAGGLNYDGCLFSHVPPGEREAAVEEFFEAAAAQAARGFVQVRLPPALARHWAGLAEGRSRG